MTTINTTNARKALYSLINKVNESHEPVHITGKNGNAVMISEDDWAAISETLFLNQIPRMTQSILDGVKEEVKDCSDKLDW